MIIMKEVWLLWMNDRLVDVFLLNGDAFEALVTLKNEITDCTWDRITKNFKTGEVRWANNRGISRLEVERRVVK
jgi:hypothetical protein